MFYTLKQAAEILELPEPQVQGFIESKQLAATFNHNIMTYVIDQDDLVPFMKDRKLWKQLQKIVVSRVLIADRDQQMTFILKNELERGGKVHVRIATASKDIELAMEQDPPDLLLMHLAGVMRGTDNIASSIRRAREARPVKVVVYHNEPDAIIRKKEDVQRILAYLNVDGTVSTAAGTRQLLAAVMDMLGLRTTMRMIRPLGTKATPRPAEGQGGKTTTRRQRPPSS